MNKDYFEDEKLRYENIEIPDELDFMVKKALKNGREKRRFKTIYKYGIGIASTFLVFVLIVNMFPTVAYAMSKIPGLDKLIELVTLDKGFDNAVEEGLVKEINFEEEQNGVKLKVNTAAGDWKSLWIDYEVVCDSEYGVSIGVNKSQEESGIPVLLGFSVGESEEERYIKIGFQEFNEKFDLKFNIFKDEEDAIEGNYIASFTVPISLESNIFNSELKDVNLDNLIINTDIGNIEIVGLKSSKTRTVMEFELNSDIYDYMNFENPKLIDDKGNEYEISSSYISNDSENDKIKRIEFQGEVKGNVKSLTFEFDKLYYARKDNRSIVVDLKDKVVEPNYYDFEFVSLIGNELILKGENIKSISFENEDNLFSEVGTSCIDEDERDDDDFYVKSYFKLNDTSMDKLELEIGWIMKDNIKGNSIELIKK